jgi:hypothetical protein
MAYFQAIQSRADARRAELKKLSDERAKRRELRIERNRLKNPVYCQMTGEVI